MSKVIERYDIEKVADLSQIRTEITPMMKGQATKQRLYLIKAFLKAASKFKDQPQEQVLGPILDLLRQMVIELISAINNSNIKIRKLAEEGFDEIKEILSPFKACS